MYVGRIMFRNLLASTSVLRLSVKRNSFHHIHRNFSSFQVQANTSIRKVPEEPKLNPIVGDSSPDKTNAPAEVTPPKRSLKQVISNYWKSLITDYSAVFKEGYQDAKDHPRRSVFLIFLVGTLGYFMCSNPSDRDFQHEYIESRSKLAVVGPAIRNSNSEEHILHLGKLVVKGQLRYQSFGFFSVVWRHDEDKCVGIYNATCEYVTPILTQAFERFVDFGFANRWWIMEKKMVDYDINEAEWQVEVEISPPGTGTGSTSSLPKQQQAS